MRKTQDNRFADAAGPVAAVDDAEGAERSSAVFEQFQRARIRAGGPEAEKYLAPFGILCGGTAALRMKWCGPMEASGGTGPSG